MTRGKWLPFERTSLGPTWPFGLDSVQGYLEMAEWYDEKHVGFVCDASDISEFNSMYFQLTQLEQEGYLSIQWEPETSSGREMLAMKQIALTTSGRNLLAQLQAKSRWGKVRTRLATIFWAAVTAVVTTLAVLTIKGI
jgi:hypothetical protein